METSRNVARYFRCGHSVVLRNRWGFAFHAHEAQLAGIDALIASVVPADNDAAEALHDYLLYNISMDGTTMDVMIEGKHLRCEIMSQHAMLRWRTAGGVVHHEDGVHCDMRALGRLARFLREIFAHRSEPCAGTFQ